MTVRQVSLRQGKYQSETMDSSEDKEERKREYNRLAQREFRRRRKEHLKSLEDAQKAQNTERNHEIERLRMMNEELRRENEHLRSQIFGSSPSSNNALLMPSQMQMHRSAQRGSENVSRAYSLSPSVTSVDPTSNPNSPPTGLIHDAMGTSYTGSQMPLTSPMMIPSINTYAESSDVLPNAPSASYTMVDASAVHQPAQGSPESSGFRLSQPTLGSSFQSMSLSLGTENSQSISDSKNPKNPMVMTPYNRNQGRKDIQMLFSSLLNDRDILVDSRKHLAVLRNISSQLPPGLKPTSLQLSTPHFFGIDLIPSPSLRERLVGLDLPTAQSLVEDLGLLRDSVAEVEQYVIWGTNPFDESKWELSQAFLERWSWLLGPEWVSRANFWRSQRGAPILPEW